MKTKTIYFFIILLLLAIFVEGGCIDCEPRNNLGVNFNIAFGRQTTFDTIRGLNIPIPIYDDTSFEQASFPINRLQDTSTFIFISDGKIDTVIVTYDLVGEIIPPDCGLLEYLDNIELFYTSFDSGYVTNPKVIFKDTINLVLRIDGE